MRRIMVSVALTATILPSLAMGQAVDALRSGETLLEVEAQGVAHAVPDVATFSVAVSADGDSAAVAWRKAAEQAGRLVASVRKVGGSTELRTQSFDAEPQYRWVNGVRTKDQLGYRATTSLNVRVAQMSRASAVLDALFAAGASRISGPTFSFADASAQNAAARRLAMIAAAGEASDYASASRKKIGRIVRISERPRDRELSTGLQKAVPLATASMPIEPGELETRVTVWVDYALSD